MPKTYLKYIGAGFIGTIPARNLTKAEAEKYNVEFLVKSGLYAYAKQPKTKKEGEQCPALNN